jgi:pectate lyase
LRIFGCVAYAHVPEDMRKKLDERSEKCVFVGYNEDSKEYRLYNQITKKYVINRDVEFKEEEAWDGSIDKIVSWGDEISHEDDDGDEKAI